MGQGSMYLWAVAGAYLIYLGIRQFIALINGTASMPLLNGAAGLVFLAVGGAVLLREWRNYRRGGSSAEEESDEQEEEGPDEEGEKA